MRGPGVTTFLKRIDIVWRRMALVRTIERGGLGLLAGSGIAIVVTLALLANHRSAMIWALIVFGVTVLAGIIWGYLRRPTRLQAAVEIDRQLALDDLFSTAMLLHAHAARADESLARAVIDSAEQRSRDLSPRSIRLRRWGGRAWAATALAVALVMVLAAMGPARSNAIERSEISHRAQARSNQNPGTASQPLLDLIAQPDVRPVALADPDDPNASHLGQNDTGPKSATQATPVEPSDTHSQAEPSAEGSGGGSARTQTPKPESATPQTPSSPPKAPTDRSNQGQVASGGGTPAKSAAGQDTTSGSATSSNSHRPAPAPPWQSPDWPRDIQQAQQTLNSGGVPVAYRDLIRDYFE